MELLLNSLNLKKRDQPTDRTNSRDAVASKKHPIKRKRDLRMFWVSSQKDEWTALVV